VLWRQVSQVRNVGQVCATVRAGRQARQWPSPHPQGRHSQRHKHHTGPARRWRRAHLPRRQPTWTAA
jgi:hypothetical protein